MNDDATASSDFGGAKLILAAAPLYLKGGEAKHVNFPFKLDCCVCVCVFTVRPICKYQNASNVLAFSLEEHEFMERSQILLGSYRIGDAFPPLFLVLLVRPWVKPRGVHLGSKSALVTDAKSESP